MVQSSKKTFALLFASLFSLSNVYSQESAEDRGFMNLLHIATPAVTPDLRIQLQEIALEIIYTSATNPEYAELASQSSEETQTQLNILNGAKISLDNGRFPSLSDFSILFQGGRGVSVASSHLTALVVVPSAENPSKEFRIILESPTVTSKGKQSLNIEEALSSPVFSEVHIIQAREVNQGEVLNELETLISSEEHEVLYEI